MKMGRVVLNRVPAVLAVFVMSLAFYCANTAVAQTFFPGNSEVVRPAVEKGYYIDWLVPNEIVFVRATTLSVSHFGEDATTFLAEGVREVGRQYVVKSETPLTTRRGNSNPTVALLLHVEWRQAEAEPKNSKNK